MLKKLFLVFALVFLLPVNAYAGVPIDAAHFPDPVFRELVKDYFDCGWDVYNSNGELIREGENDGILSDKEIIEVKQLHGKYYGRLDKIKSLKGIEYFTALESLSCNATSLTELDVSHNKALKKLSCQNKLMTKLDVSGCTALEYLDCGYSQLTMLKLGNLPALIMLYCNDNRLTELNVNGCTALDTLYCYNNPLTVLDVRGCTALRLLKLYNTSLTLLDVSGLKALDTLYCYNNQLTSLDVSDCTALKNLSCGDNQLTQLDVSSCTALEFLNCYNNQLTQLDLNENISLFYSVQTRGGLNVNKTSGGYKVDLKDYVDLDHLENIASDSIYPPPLSYNEETGIITFGVPITYLNYSYNTHASNDEFMHVTITNSLSIANIERRGFGTDGLIIRGMTEKNYLNSNGNSFTEVVISLLNYSDYGKLGIAADGNSRLILRVKTDKPGTVSFSLDDNIGAKLEALTSRAKLSASGSAKY